MAACLSTPGSKAPAAPYTSAAAGPCAVLTGTEPNFVQLIDIQVTNQGTYDSVVFTFDPRRVPGGPQSWELKEVTGPFHQDPSDHPLPVAGSTFYELTFKGASGVDLSGSSFIQTYNGPTRFTPNYPTLAEAALRSDYERELMWVLGLSQDRCPSAAVRGTALVVDFPH